MTSTNLFQAFLSEVDAPEPEVAAPFAVKAPAVTHKLTFRRGRAKNFRSIGNDFLEVDYQRNPSTLVTSDDNGAGKSTLMVWLPIFVLFNDTYSKQEKKSGLVNSISRKDCVGEIEFFTKGEEWKVRRGIKPDFVEIHKLTDGVWVQLENEAGKENVNKMIEGIVGIDQKMLENAIVLGKEKFIPFSEMMTADRRLMVETIWDLGFFSVMNEEVKAAIKKINIELSDVDEQVQNLERGITHQRSLLEQAEQSNSLIQQTSRTALDAAVEDRDQVKRTQAQLQETLNTHQESLDASETEAREIRQKEITAGDAEINALVESYVEPAAAIKAEGEQAVQAATDAVTARAAGREELVSEIGRLQDEKAKIVDQREEHVQAVSKAITQREQGSTFRVRFETEISGHQKAIERFHSMGECPTCTQLVSEETKGRISAEYQPKIDELNGKLEAINARVAAIEQEMETHRNNMAELDTEITVAQSRIDGAKAKLAEYDFNTRELQGAVTQAKGKMEQELRTLESAKQTRLEDLRVVIANRADLLVKTHHESIAATRRVIAGVKSDLYDVEQRLGIANNRVKEIEKQLAVEPLPTEGYRTTITNYEAELLEQRVAQVHHDNNRQDHEHLLFLLRDDQTKARIISLYLPFLNSKVNEYLEALNMFIQIQIDDKFGINMMAPDRKGQSIFSLSTGQRSRLNLAITLALRDVANLKASVQCNILVLDEILENMSERGVQESVLMLHNKFKGNNLFVISQREQEFQEYFEHNIRYGLRNGLTTVIARD